MIGEKIKQLRLEHNLTQIELAEKIESQQPQVNRWESGKKLPSLLMLIKISRLFNVSLDTLVMDEKDLKTLKIKDKTLLSKLKEIENLTENEKEIVINMIHTLATKKS